MEKRDCGGCTACCKTHGITEMKDKKLGQWCTHCQVGRGCAIYPTRPEECRTFRCQWLLGYGAEADRPDKSKLVVDSYVHPTLHCETVGLWEVTEGAFGSKFCKTTRDRLFAAATVVMQVPLKGPIRLLVPEGQHLSPEFISASVKERVLVERYTPLR